MTWWEGSDPETLLAAGRTSSETQGSDPSSSFSAAGNDKRQAHHRRHYNNIIDYILIYMRLVIYQEVRVLHEFTIFFHFQVLNLSLSNLIVSSCEETA